MSRKNSKFWPLLENWKARQRGVALLCSDLEVPGTSCHSPLYPQPWGCQAMPSVSLLTPLVFLYPAHFARFHYLPGVSKLWDIGWKAIVMLQQCRGGSPDHWNSLLNDLLPHNPPSCWWTWSQSVMLNSKNVTSLLENFQWVPSTVASINETFL